MKQAKSRYTKCLQWVIGSLLGLLGFSGCEDGIFGKDEPMDMYGVPTADYIVKGTVTDEAGNPIEGLLVTPYLHYGTFAPSQYPTTTTEKDGTFKLDTLKGMGIPPIVVADPDGEANGGHFIPDTLTMKEFEQIKLKDGKGAWYNGVFELKADIKLKKEK